MNRKSILKDGSPKIVVSGTTVGHDGTWRTYGAVTFDLETGESVSMPFKEAASEFEAKTQAVAALETYVKRLERAALQVREDLA